MDGLRALAVISVLLYHGDVASLKGGFLGVEVFFVISGYLITAILLAERKNNFRINLRRFYARRARRLLPALGLVLFGTLLITAVFHHDELATLRGDVTSSLLYVTNWFFIVGQKSYFEAVGRPSLVQHLWSLAVEEQFYLLWPLIFTVGMRFLGRRRLFIATITGALASAALMAALYQPGSDPTRVYYGTDTRAAGLLIGAALAFVWAPYRLKKTVGRGAPALLNLVGGVSLVVLIMMLMVTDQYGDALYYGGFLRVSVVTAVVIAVVVHPAASLGKLIGIRPIRWVGLRSYGIYLYHWPIFQLTRPQLDVPWSGFPLLAARLGLTFLVAALSYRYVEMPVRHGAIGRHWRTLRAASDRAGRQQRTRWMGASLAMGAVMVLLIMVSLQAEPAATPEYLLAGSTTQGLPPGSALLPPVSSPRGTALATNAANTDSRSHAVGTSPTTTAPSGGLDPATGVATTVPDPALVVAAADTVPPPPIRIAAIGDSVMLGAAPALSSTLNGTAFVDARVGRQVDEGLSILRQWRDMGLLGDVVVVHLGNNGTFSAEQFDEMHSILIDVPKVIFLTVKVPRSWQDGVNEVITNGVATMPNAVLIDWKAESDPRPDLFWNDGMHLRPEGAAVYAELINARL